MNGFEYATKTVKGGVLAYLRVASDGELKPLLAKGGKAELFSSKEAALEKILDRIISYISGHYVRDGEVAGETASAAEAVFKPVLRQKGKTRVISVAYKGQGRRCEKQNHEEKLRVFGQGTATAASS